jgi:hypothetical protein
MLRVSCLAAVLACASAAPAEAADTLSITPGPDPREEVYSPITATWSASQADLRVIVTSKGGSQGCGATYAADDRYSQDWINRLVGATGSTARSWRLMDPGTVTLCGYLMRASDSVPLAATGPVPMTYRSATAGLQLQVPPRVTPGQIFRLTVPVSSELRREVIVTRKPMSPGGCGANYALDAPLSEDLMWRSTQFDQTLGRSVKAPSADGIYLLCGYVVERPGDPAPEAVTSASFEVGPDLCAQARDKLAAAKRAVRSRQSKVDRYRRAYRRADRRASRTHGARHAKLRRQARRLHARYDGAVRARDAARGAAGSAQTEVTAACGG